MKRFLFWSIIILAVVGFSGVGESMYWGLAAPLSVVLLAFYIPLRLLESEMEQYEQDQETRRAAIKASPAASKSAHSRAPLPPAKEPEQVSRAA